MQRQTSRLRCNSRYIILDGNSRRVLARHSRSGIQSNLDSSDTEGSFTMANSNSFLSSYEILPIAR